MPDRGMIFNKLEKMNKDNLYTAYNEWLLTDDAMGVMKDNLTNLVGLVGSFVYSYKNSYIFNVNGRIDFSNKFEDVFWLSRKYVCIGFSSADYKERGNG